MIDYFKMDTIFRDKIFIFITCYLWFAGLCFGITSNNKALQILETCNLRWESPSENSWGSMPQGNGDIGANFWVEPDGDIVFYISKTDAWSENTRLLKLGRIRIRFEPNVITADSPFLQILNLKNGEIHVKAGPPKKEIDFHFRIDANHPLIELEGESEADVSMRVELELWRTQKRELGEKEAFSAYGGPTPVIVEPDIVFEKSKNSLLWCHRNAQSPWDNLGIDKHPQLNLPARQDPLLNRTFGCLAEGTGLVNQSNKILISAKPSKKFNLHIYALTAQTDTLDDWTSRIKTISESIKPLNTQNRIHAHQKWWHDFWTRSWLFIDGDKEAIEVTRGYTLQRFMNACSGRGAQPIKFNGSIFTMDMEPGLLPAFGVPEHFDADYRRWGGMYWWQNTRLIYWTMLWAGDFDLMQPLFDTYMNMLPLARARAKIHYDCDGAVFFEVTPWYGFNISQPPYKEPGYVTYYFQSGLELAAMMMQYYDFTQDVEFLKNKALPLADAVVSFYFCAYQRDANGTLHIEPAQALETYWEVVNPTPVVAGLDYLTERLLAVPEKYVSKQDRNRWQGCREALPEYATRKLNGVEVLSPAGTILKDERKNMENPELYAIFPYMRFGLGHDNLDLAVRTYENRIEKRTGGWFYDCIMAACLGKSQEAAKIVHRNLTVPHAADPSDAPPPIPCRFPNFLGPNYDWVPDQDQPSVAMIALQRMLLQMPDSEILLFPAWPAEWNVFFRMHAVDKTTITGEYRDGKMSTLRTNLPFRAKNIRILAKSEDFGNNSTK